MGYIGEHTAYHHGEMSLSSTIVGLAQNYIGSNNINLLLPKGQFGSRAMGGKDHASARYIFTALNKITRYIFREEDDHTLEYLEDDGQMVEPKYYVPIIPMCLINGCEGIGTGWSTSIPNYNPREIVDAILAKIEGREFRNLKPYYRGYNGLIEPKGDGFVSRGQIELCPEKCVLEILELPIGKWTSDYKKFVESMFDEKQTKYQIEEFSEYHTTENVHFRLEYTQDTYDRLISEYNTEDQLEKYFRLQGVIHTSNLVLFNDQLKLQRFESIVPILERFYEIRIEHYKKRKEYLKSRLVRDLTVLEEKIKFILAFNEDKIKIKKRKRMQICEDLQAFGLKKMSEIPKILSTKPGTKGSAIKYATAVGSEEQGPKIDDDDDNLGRVSKNDSDSKPKNPEDEKEERRKNFEQSLVDEYDYLVSMPLWSLSLERVEDLRSRIEACKKEIEELEKVSIYDMYRDDLEAFLKQLDKIEQKQKADIIAKDKKIKKAPNLDLMKKRNKKVNKKRDSSKSQSASPLPGKAKGKAKDDGNKQEAKKIKKIVDKKGEKSQVSQAPAQKSKMLPGDTEELFGIERYSEKELVDFK